MESGTCGSNEAGELGGSSGAAAAGASRWNPTKEQIEILEGLYKQGIRTPTAEQIQQITGRLRAYGHIEGKNVFYWFQNHKARQRQKEKQESLAFLSRYFHHRSGSAAAAAVAAFPSPCPNVICGPCYMPPSELGFYQIHQKVLIPCGYKRRQRSDYGESFDPRCQKPHNYPNLQNQCSEFTKREESNIGMSSDCDHDMTLRTLDLFPLHPTGIVDGNARETLDVPAGSSEVLEDSNEQQNLVYIDFFSGNKNCC
ncbi:hypothetical protein CRG98_017920 [Punica granatum]|uniref:Homeobox domain-containing protein n=1 Tax=Punica granatum TaxID=22663 RepID=A0A2I0K1X0_PUNGR|nr:hypothetical protein CRG98_017920 [Punica granatum]